MLCASSVTTTLELNSTSTNQEQSVGLYPARLQVSALESCALQIKT